MSSGGAAYFAKYCCLIWERLEEEAALPSANARRRCGRLPRGARAAMCERKGSPVVGVECGGVERRAEGQHVLHPSLSLARVPEGLRLLALPERDVGSPERLHLLAWVEVVKVDVAAVDEGALRL